MLFRSDSGETREEWKMVAETKKILDKSIKVTATCVRVPVFVGHSEAVNIEFEEFLDEDEARDILREFPGIMVIDKREDGGYITPIDCVGDYATYVSRIRQDSTIDNGISMCKTTRAQLVGEISVCSFELPISGIEPKGETLRQISAQK